MRVDTGQEGAVISYRWVCSSICRAILEIQAIIIIIISCHEAHLGIDKKEVNM